MPRIVLPLAAFALTPGCTNDVIADRFRGVSHSSSLRLTKVFVDDQPVPVEPWQCQFVAVRISNAPLTAPFADLPGPTYVTWLYRRFPPDGGTVPVESGACGDERLFLADMYFGYFGP